MKPLRPIAFLLIFGILLAAGLQGLEIKLGSLAPEGSPWDSALKRIAAEWRRISGGRVTLKIYAGGVAGDEPDMIRKMRINQIQAAALTGLGLNMIVPDVMVIQLPFLVHSDDELDYVLEKMKPTLEEQAEEKGFKILIWSVAGWANFFSKEPVILPDDLRRQKMFVMEGHTELDQAWKELGFHVIPISPNNALTALQSGMVEALTSTPLLAAAMQWFGLAPHMCDLKFAPLIGVFVITTTAWKRISADLQPKMLEALRQIERDLREETKTVERKALEVMVKNGLIVHNIPPEAREEWERIVARGFELVVDRAFSRQIYEQATGYRDEYRKSHGQ